MKGENVFFESIKRGLQGHWMIKKATENKTMFRTPSKAFKNLLQRKLYQGMAKQSITLVYKNTFLVWGKNGDRCLLLIWVCWIQIYK